MDTNEIAAALQHVREELIEIKIKANGNEKELDRCITHIEELRRDVSLQSKSEYRIDQVEKGLEGVQGVHAKIAWAIILAILSAIMAVVLKFGV